MDSFSNTHNTQASGAAPKEDYVDKGMYFPHTCYLVPHSLWLRD